MCSTETSYTLQWQSLKAFENGVNDRNFCTMTGSLFTDRKMFSRKKIKVGLFIYLLFRYVFKIT